MFLGAEDNIPKGNTSQGSNHGEKRKVTFTKMLVATHGNRELEDVTVAAEVQAPAWEPDGTEFLDAQLPSLKMGSYKIRKSNPQKTLRAVPGT